MAFKNISVDQADLEVYRELSGQLSKELGTKVSIAQTLNIAVKFYKDRRKFVKPSSQREQDHDTR